ncbi:MAG: ABC transporter permease, partial [Saezia sp.]
YAQQIVQTYAQEVSAQQPLAGLSVRYAYNPNLIYHWFVLPALVAIIATVGCLIVTALSLAREKEEGTLDQLLVTPLTTGYVLIGKAIPGVMVGMVQGMIIAICAVVFYKVPMSSHWALLLLAMFCYSLSVVGVGLFVSALCSTQQQAFLGVFCYMVPSVILSGFIGPVENMPPVLYTLSRANPLTHFIDASQGIFLKYHTLAQAWPHLWPMLLIAMVTLTASYLLFYRRTAS